MFLRCAAPAPPRPPPPRVPRPPGERPGFCRAAPPFCPFSGHKGPTCRPPAPHPGKGLPPGKGPVWPGCRPRSARPPKGRPERPPRKALAQAARPPARRLAHRPPPGSPARATPAQAPGCRAPPRPGTAPPQAARNQPRQALHPAKVVCPGGGIESLGAFPKRPRPTLA